MSDDLVRLGMFVANYTSAMKSGMDKFAGMLPVLVDQKITAVAGDKLHSTREEFLGAVNTTMNNYVLLVELDPDNFIANAVEGGLNPFSMKETHLKSPNAKWGKPDKNGVSYKYLRIPIGKTKDGHGGGTPKSQKIQEKINQVMNKPQFGMAKLKTMVDGTVMESQKILTVDNDIQGLYRVRKFTDADHYRGAKAKPKWNLVMFRTMSERPFTAAWEHPGIPPANIFKEVESWLKANVDAMLDTFLQNEVSKIEY